MCRENRPQGTRTCKKGAEAYHWTIKGSLPNGTLSLAGRAPGLDVSSYVALL